ncbi:MAG: hypothetical protein HQK76_20960 [Desulfobacterales bacterium]|nr:hypothetical protein [Desulfobacterales bacterium]
MNYFLWYPIPEDTAKRLIALLKMIREQPIKGKYTDEFVDIAIELTECQFNYSLVEGLNVIDANAFMRGVVAMGIKVTLSVTAKALRRVFSNLSENQLLLIADHIESLIHEDRRTAGR